MSCHGVQGKGRLLYIYLRSSICVGSDQRMFLYVVTLAMMQIYSAFHLSMVSWSVYKQFLQGVSVKFVGDIIPNISLIQSFKTISG
jgi:hypothetical protein